MGRSKEPWKQEHDDIYGGDNAEEADPQAQKRRNTAAAILNGLEKYDLWLVVTPSGFQIKPLGDTKPADVMSEKDLKLILAHLDELAEMTSHRVLDGTKDSRLVVFLDDMSYYDSERKERYDFEAGTMKVCRFDLAEKLVATPSAEYHPGPEEGRK